MKMKQKLAALLLALVMCLTLLSACGANSTPGASEPPAPESTAQPAADEKDEPPEGEEPKESEAPAPEEPENNAGTEFLALLQEEWNNGFFEGEGPNHTYYSRISSRKGFIHNEILYYFDKKGHDDITFWSYDLATKETKESVSVEFIGNGPGVTVDFVDGSFYYLDFIFDDYPNSEMRKYDSNGECLTSFQGGSVSYLFEKGILLIYSDKATLMSYDFEKIADIPAPQRELEHGLKEDINLISDADMFVADGTVYAMLYIEHNLYRLNTDTCEWENLGEVDVNNLSFTVLCGKYISRNDGIYDRITGEQVFEYGELYPAVDDYNNGSLYYFGGDKYLGVKNREYRWVSLTDLSMSDPLPFPEGKTVTILNDTYCVYKDDYGMFLWNYNTGEEEMILLFGS